MSSEYTAENSVAKPSLKDVLAKMDDMNNKYSISDMSFPLKPSGGVGDVPCLISDETPPATVLELTSEQDLHVLASSSEIDVAAADGDDNIEGEGTDMKNISPSSPLSSSSSEKVISSLGNGGIPGAPALLRLPDGNKMLSQSYDLTQPFDLLSRKISTASQNHNERAYAVGEKYSNESNGSGNLSEENMLKVSDTHFETIDTSASSPESEQVDDDITNTTTAEGSKPVESRAVIAPEPEGTESEEYDDVPSLLKRLDGESLNPGTFSEKEENHKKVEKIAMAGNNEEQLPEEESQNENDSHQHSHSHVTSSSSSADKKSEPSFSACSSSSTTRKQVGKDMPLPSTTATIKVKTNDDLWKERSRSRNRHPSPAWSIRRSRLSSGSRSRNRHSSKSPARPRVAVVEVHHRNSPVGFKTMKGKYASPYQCKIFPVKTTPQRKNAPFAVDPMTHRMLDTELARILQRDKVLLIEAMAQYYERRMERWEVEGSSASVSSSAYFKTKIESEANVNESSIISRGSTRETFMSWIMKEKNRELDNEGIQYFNPMANIFRKTRSTQVSEKPSFVDGEKNDDDGIEVSRTTDCKIHLVGGDEQENQVRFAAQNMYQSLKLLQKVIHLSDLFCFRESLPETATVEDETTTFCMPEFQQFMESGNEIEILENVMKLLGNSKENIGQYLSSLQEANLVTGKYSGLTKIVDPKSSNNNNNTEIDDPDAPSTSSKHAGESVFVEVDEEAGEKEEEKVAEAPRNQIIPLTCPSCQSQLDVEVNTFPRNPILPKVHTFLEEQKKLTLCTYYNTNFARRTLIQTVTCDGLRYKIQFTTTEPCGPIQGIQLAKREYMGQPSPLSLDMLLSTIHRCTSYVDTRVACSCVWNRQSQHFLLAFIEKYLDKDYRPSTKMSRWHIYKLEKKLKKINTFAGIVRNLCDELVEAVSKIQFCMQKSMMLLEKSLKRPGLPGFTPSRTLDCTIGWEEMNQAGEVDFNKYNRDCKDEIEKTQSVELLYRKLKSKMHTEKESSLQKIFKEKDGNANENEDENISVEALMEITALAVKDIIAMCTMADDCVSNVKMPGRNARRVMRFMNATIAQLGCTKDIDMGALIATFLSAVEKLSMFEEFMCEQKVEIRSGIHKMCGKIIRKLCQLRSHIWMQKHWSRNLAKNSYMKIKEINEVKRLWKLKKNRDEIEDQLQGIRGSDESLRLSVY